MYDLNERHKAILQDLLNHCNLATRELDESFETGRMSDAKAFVYNVKQNADNAELPTALSDTLKEMAQEAWHGTSSAGGDVYERASKGLAAIGNLERFITAQLTSGSN